MTTSDTRGGSGPTEAPHTGPGTAVDLAGDTAPYPRPEQDSAVGGWPPPWSACVGRCAPRRRPPTGGR
ncbi:hypothetical protein LUX12_22080 [Streptomyces somaliensis]|nr:hypothetical protein [Streptomyces somaliensis]MCP9946888.1 hypothetical protein [Streptomyces somaliensis]